MGILCREGICLDMTHVSRNHNEPAVFTHFQFNLFTFSFCFYQTSILCVSSVLFCDLLLRLKANFPTVTSLNFHLVLLLRIKDPQSESGWWRPFRCIVSFRKSTGRSRQSQDMELLSEDACCWEPLRLEPDVLVTGRREVLEPAALRAQRLEPGVCGGEGAFPAVLQEGGAHMGGGGSNLTWPCSQHVFNLKFNHLHHVDMFFCPHKEDKAQ